MCRVEKVTQRAKGHTECNARADSTDWCCCYCCCCRWNSLSCIFEWGFWVKYLNILPVLESVEAVNRDCWTRDVDGFAISAFDSWSYFFVRVFLCCSKQFKLPLVINLALRNSAGNQRVDSRRMTESKYDFRWLITGPTRWRWPEYIPLPVVMGPFKKYVRLTGWGPSCVTAHVESLCKQSDMGGVNNNHNQLDIFLNGPMVMLQLIVSTINIFLQGLSSIWNNYIQISCNSVTFE